MFSSVTGNCSTLLDSNGGGSTRTCLGLRKVGLSPVVDFLTVGLSDIKESQNIASLHNQIAACDSILEVRTTARPGGGRAEAPSEPAQSRGVRVRVRVGVGSAPGLDALKPHPQWRSRCGFIVPHFQNPGV